MTNADRMGQMRWVLYSSRFHSLVEGVSKKKFSGLRLDGHISIAMFILQAFLVLLVDLFGSFDDRPGFVRDHVKLLKVPDTDLLYPELPDESRLILYDQKSIMRKLKTGSILMPDFLCYFL